MGDACHRAGDECHPTVFTPRTLAPGAEERRHVGAIGGPGLRGTEQEQRRLQPHRAREEGAANASEVASLGKQTPNPGGADLNGEPPRFARRDSGPEPRQLEHPAVVCNNAALAGLEQALLQEAIERPVQGAGVEADAAVGALLDGRHNVVPMPRPVRQREQDFERHGRQGEKGGRVCCLSCICLKQVIAQGTYYGTRTRHSRRHRERSSEASWDDCGGG